MTVRPIRIRQHGMPALIASMSSTAMPLCAPAGLRRNHVPDLVTGVTSVFWVALFD